MGRRVATVLLLNEANDAGSAADQRARGELASRNHGVGHCVLFGDLARGGRSRWRGQGRGGGQLTSGGQLGRTGRAGGEDLT